MKIRQDRLDERFHLQILFFGSKFANQHFSNSKSFSLEFKPNWTNLVLIYFGA
jgi:hypothetical protein